MGAPPTELESLLACPACFAGLVHERGVLRCESCGKRYELDDGRPVLAEFGESRGAHKEQQVAYFDDADEEFEIERPRGTSRLYKTLIEEKLQRSVSTIGDVVRSGTALAVCGGSGMEAEFLVREGAEVITSDISRGAARRARERSQRHGRSFLSIVADVEALPFADRSIDLVYVHDGLHHLQSPLRGLGEMARVARRAVSINEPANAALTALARRLGLADEVEEAGNRVERLTLDLLIQHLHGGGFRVTEAERYAMVYRHRPGRASHALSRPGAFQLAEVARRASRFPARRFGNKLTVQAIRTA